MGVKIRSDIEKVARYVAGKPISEVKRELGLEKVVKMASNENPLGCSNKVKEAIKNLTEQTFMYPDAGNHNLLCALADKYGVDKDEIFLGAGSSSLIKVICNCILEKGDECIMPELTFPLYENYTNLMGGKSIKIPMNDLKIDLEAMVQAITDRTKIIWFCNPNNPTGTIFTSEEFERILNRIPDDILIVMDEAYVEYVSNNNFPSSFEVFKNHKNFVILRTFSKAYGLASLRVAYGIADKSIVSYFNRVLTPFEVNLYSQTAAVEALSDIDFLEKVKAFNSKQREVLYDGLDKMSYEYIKSQSNFILMKVSNDKELCDYLLKNGFIIRAGYLLGCEGYVRISIGKEEDNIELLRLLDTYKKLNFINLK